MPVFEYQALNAKGRATRGTIDAENVRAARLKLKRQGIFPTAVAEAGESKAGRSWNIQIQFRRKGINLSELAVATRQLSTLVGAGMPLVESLRALTEQIDSTHFRRVVSEVSELVNQGSTMADSMRNFPRFFPRLYVNMIASGEASGTLDLVLQRLADLLESQAALRRKVLAALTYPLLMVFLCVGVLVLLLTFVVPQITAIFREQHAILPLPTRVVIFFSDAVRNYWWLGLGGAALFIFWLLHYRRTQRGRQRLDSAKLRAPIIGGLTLKIATSRFARNLGTMLESGIEVLTALAIVKNIIGNTILEESVEAAIGGVREGRDLASELNRAKVFPRLLIHMISIGERTGQLEQMLLRAADSYESEVNAAVTGLTSVLEPILIVFLASVVGGILASVMLPMLEMSTLAGH